MINQLNAAAALTEAFAIINATDGGQLSGADVVDAMLEWRTRYAETLVAAATLWDDPPAPGHGDEYVGEALDQCKYGNGADCNNLPLGVRRSPCKPCQARAKQDAENPPAD